jgi:hypothetical protein
MDVGISREREDDASFERGEATEVRCVGQEFLQVG